MKVRTSELIDWALDWAAAKADGLTPLHHFSPAKGHHVVPHPYYEGYNFGFTPSTDWEQGGPIIERMGEAGLSLRRGGPSAGNQRWWASLDTPNGFFHGPTPLIAAMRCYVASKLGDEVDVPDELRLPGEPHES